MKKSTEEQLARVQAVISAIEGGAETYEVPTPTGFREYTYDDLENLYGLEERLQIRLRKENQQEG